jgi:hypothetical protein
MGPCQVSSFGSVRMPKTETILEEGHQQLILQIASEFQVVGFLCVTGKKRIK